MAGAPFIVDPYTFNKLLAGYFKDSNDKITEHITTAVEAYKKDNKDDDANIFGLREQIIAIAETLVPTVGSKDGTKFETTKGWAVTPDIHVVTVGEAPEIKVYVLEGPTTRCNIVLESDAGSTPAAALNNMLVLTQKMLATNIGNFKAFSAKRSDLNEEIAPEGYMVCTGLFDRCDIAVEKCHEY